MPSRSFATRTPFRLATAAILASMLWSPQSHAQDVDDAAAWLVKGEYEECLKVCQGAIDAGAYGEGWRLLKAEVELATGKYQAARDTLTAAIETYTWSVKLRIRLREALRYTGATAEQVAALEAEIAQLVEASPWRYTDAENLVLLGQLALEMGADAKEVQDSFLQRARRNNPVHRLPRLALGRLALEKRDFPLAAEIFKEGCVTFEHDPDFLFGHAEAIEGSDPERAQQLREQVAAVNPHYIPLLLQQTDHLIESEAYDEAESQLSQVLGINETHPAALAYWAVIAHLRNDLATEQDLRKEALSTWGANPEVDHIIGRELSQKYRFKEGAAYQRQALAFDAKYAPAQKQLASDLLRLGQEAEGWDLVNQAYTADQYDVTLYNLITLKDELAAFSTLERDGFILRMDAAEAAAYGETVLELLRHAREYLGKKYRVELREPVLVEIFPNPSDFAVRTFGMPGVAGYLGVCFGNVITANSPASQELTPANWESVLWHEFAHVVTLNLTHNRMPRWVSEGISVYEERQHNGAWGERMTPAYRQMILGGDLTPVGKLSGAFLNPKSAAHVQFAYYESSLVIEYVIDTYGFEALHKVLVDLGAGVTINEALERHTTALPELEEQFAAYATKLANEFAPDTDWSEPQLEFGDSPEQILVKFLEDHPDNYAALQMYAELLLRDPQRQAKAELILRKLTVLHPTATGADAPALKLADLYRKTGRREEEFTVLMNLAKTDDAAISAYLRLIEISREEEGWDVLYTSGQRLRAVDPLTPHPHRAIADAAEHLGDNPQVAVGALQSLLAVSPDDPAGTYYRIARQYLQLGDAAAAKRHVLKSLEEAPRFREAQTLLLDLVDAPAARENNPARPAF